MFLIPKNLRIVEISSIYDSIENEGHRDLLGKVLALKVRGYRKEYPYGVLPVDSYDFIATHLVVCAEIDGQEAPIMAYKSVTLEKAEKHRLLFPALAVLKSSGAEVHARELEKILDRCRSKKIPLSYGSSWTIDPKIREDKPLKNFLKDLMTAMLICQEQDTKTPERIGCGAPRLRTDLYFQKLGYQLIEHEGKPLPEFKQASLIGEPAVIMHCKSFSEYGLELANRYRSLWNDRLILRNESDEAAVVEVQAKKAA